MILSPTNTSFFQNCFGGFIKYPWSLSHQKAWEDFDVHIARLVSLHQLLFFLTLKKIIFIMYVSDCLGACICALHMHRGPAETRRALRTEVTDSHESTHRFWEMSAGLL